ncbi:MAG: ParB/RepB/Spo0J family partition protein [Gemmatimonadaceae bacterium]|nr:ParB/RepB/Spo0J family partition protein [Gemmatimonadaceae bacterium]
MADKPRLGRGLEALLSSKPVPRSESTRGGAERETGRDGVRRIPLGEIRPNPLQPRKEFREENLADLESSLRTNGLIQPITLRPAPSGSGYEIITGERRFRAAKRLNWTDIPAIVRDVNDRDALTLALVENLQRTDLNPIEEAEGYQQLMSQYSLTQQETAELVGKDRSTVANMLRLLALPASVRRQVRDGALSLGHARALLSLGDDIRIAELAKVVVTDGLSVREVERRVREATGGEPRAGRKNAAAKSGDARPAEARLIEEQLRRKYQTDVKLALTGQAQGQISFSFYNNEDLSRLLDLLLGASERGIA